MLLKQQLIPHLGSFGDKDVEPMLYLNQHILNQPYGLNAPIGDNYGKDYPNRIY
jgi:hypothetical protein